MYGMSDSSEGLDARSGLEEVEPAVDVDGPAISLSPKQQEDADPAEAQSDSDESLQSVSSEEDSDLSDLDVEADKDLEAPGDVPALDSEASISDTESETEQEEERYQKLDPEGRASFLSVYHPEAKAHNFEEVRGRAEIVRNAQGRIADPGHRSLPFLSKYELTRVLGLRARQLDAGAPPLVKVPAGVMDGYTVAEAELSQKKIPFIIRRPMPGGTSEYWRLQDLELLRAPAGLSSAPSPAT